MKSFYRQSQLGCLTLGSIPFKGSKEWFKNNPAAVKITRTQYEKERAYLECHLLNQDSLKQK